MPRNSQNMVWGYGSGTNYLGIVIPVSNTSVFPTAFDEEEATKFSEVRALLAETVTRIVQRDPNTNGVLAGIATGRNILHDLSQKYT